MADFAELLARYEAARARRRSQLRQAQRDQQAGSAAIYQGYDADTGRHQARQSGQFLEADSLTTGGLSPGDRAEGTGGFLDATPRPRQAQTRRRTPRRLRTFLTALLYCKYQYGPRATAYDGTLYERYRSSLCLKEPDKDLIVLLMPWRGQPVFGLPTEDYPLGSVVGYDGDMNLATNLNCNVLYISRQVRIVQVVTSLTPVDPSSVSYPVRITRQPNESPEGTLLDTAEAWGYYASLFTFKVVGGAIERMEVSRDPFLPVGQAVAYSDWWADYQEHLYLGVNYAPSALATGFPDYDSRSIAPGLGKTVYRGKVFTIAKPKELNELRAVKHFLTRNNYQVGINRPVALFVDPSEFQLPDDSDLRSSFVQSAALQPFTTWLASDGLSFTGPGTFYERNYPPGPLPAYRFWTVEIGNPFFFAFAY